MLAVLDMAAAVTVATAETVDAEAIFAVRWNVVVTVATAVTVDALAIDAVR